MIFGTRRSINRQRLGTNQMNKPSKITYSILDGYFFETTYLFMPNSEKACVGERRTGFCPFHVATVAKTGLQIPKTWPSYRILAIFMSDALGRCNQVLSHLTMMQYIHSFP